jgi:hypothetical protein
MIILIHAGADFTVSVIQEKIFSRFGVSAEPPTMAVFHHARLHIPALSCSYTVHYIREKNKGREVLKYLGTS